MPPDRDCPKVEKMFNKAQILHFLTTTGKDFPWIAAYRVPNLAEMAYKIERFRL